MGEKDSPENLYDEVVFKIDEVKKYDVYVIEHFKDSVSGAEKESEAIISDSESVVVEMVKLFLVLDDKQ